MPLSSWEIDHKGGDHERSSLYEATPEHVGKNAVDGHRSWMIGLNLLFAREPLSPASLLVSCSRQELDAVSDGFSA